jgi:class 3 adenylate cyclase
MPGLPTGSVTFFFTDIEGSTRLWEQKPESMRQALAHHDTLVRTAIESNNGHVFKTVGDAFFAVFANTVEAVHAAVEAQSALHKHLPQVRVRMAIHTGQAETRESDYFGPALNRVSRLLAAGHGGQVLLSQATAEPLQASLPSDIRLRPLGTHRLRDIAATETIYQLLPPGLPSDFPPLNTLDVAFRRGILRATAICGIVVAVLTGMASVAVRQARRAEAGERTARRERYAAQMSLADQAWAVGNVGRAAQLLEAQRPKPEQEDLRGFEWRYLWRRCYADVHSTLQGHAAAVTSVVFSPDGKILATGSDDKSVKLWDIGSHRELTSLPGPTDLVHTVRFSPDGKLVAAADGPAIRVWSFASRQEIACLRGHQAGVWPVAFSPDGRLLASGSYDGTAKLWDIHSRRAVATLRGHQYAVRGVAFSPNGEILATGSFDQTIKLWDVSTHREVASLKWFIRQVSAGLG